MKIRIVILLVACISCMVPDVRSAPFGNAVSLGAAVGAFKGALNGAASASASTKLAKNVGAIVKFIGRKALGALKDVALKSAVPVASLGAGVAIGAAVAKHKPHILKALTEHHHEPILLESFPSNHNDHLQETVSVADAPVFHHQTQELSYGAFSGYHESAPLSSFHSQQHVEGIYR